MLRLKESQNNLMDVIGMIAKDNCPDARARRDFRMKYPDDVMLHQLNGRSSHVDYEDSVQRTFRSATIYKPTTR